jgi:hypothetical protein
VNTIALVAPGIPLMELYCADVWLQGRLTGVNSHTHYSGDWLTLCFLLYITLGRPNRKPNFTTVGYHATRQYQVVSVSMEPFDHGYLVTSRVLHSNDGLRSNTSQYYAHSINEKSSSFAYSKCFGNMKADHHSHPSLSYLHTRYYNILRGP